MTAFLIFMMKEGTIIRQDDTFFGHFFERRLYKTRRL